MSRLRGTLTGACRSTKGLDVAQEMIRSGRALACLSDSLVYADDETLQAQAKNIDVSLASFPPRPGGRTLPARSPIR